MANPEPFYTKNIIGMHLLAQYRPEQNWPFIIKALYYFWRLIIFSCLTFTLVFTFLDVYINGFNKISDVAIHVINMSIYSSIVIRTFYFMYNHDIVEYLMYRMNIVMKESSSFAFTEYTMKKGRHISDMALIVWQSYIVGCGFLFSIWVVFKSPRELPLPMWTFFDFSNNLYYYLTLSLQILTQMFMVASYGNIEIFNISFHILLRHQFELLGEDFKYLIPDVLHKCGMSRQEVEDYMENPEDEKLMKLVGIITNTEEFQNGVVENFKTCIAHHQSLLVYRDEFYEFISPLLVIELNFIFEYLIFALFSIVTTDNSAFYFPLFTYICAILTQVYMITLFGELLTNQVEELRTILYNIPWYICDRKFLIDFKFVQLRMIKNDYLKAGKMLSISLENCLEFIRVAGSFFAVLRQVNNAEDLIVI